MDANDRTLVDQVEDLMKAIGAKWKPAIMFCLVSVGRQRFSALRRAIPDVTQKMLTQRLRELERDGLVRRIVHDTQPPQVEYEVTDLGRSLHPFYRDLCAWGQQHAMARAAANRAYDARTG